MTPPAAVVRRTLTRAGALDRIDRSFTILREVGFGAVARAWLGGSLVATASLVVAHAEEEGLSALRWPLAWIVVLAFQIRAWLLADVARACVAVIAGDVAETPTGPVRFLPTARTASLVLGGLVPWAFVVALSLAGGVLGVLGVLPLLAIRGFWAPSWIARAGMEAAGGWAALSEAFRDSTGQRWVGVAIESWLLAACLVMAVMLGATLAVLVMLGRSFLGLDAAFVEQFASVRNGFVLAGAPLFAAVVLEPMRAAVSAQAYVQARIEDEGLDLKAAVAKAIAATLAIACLVGVNGSMARAQVTTEDLQVRDDVIEVLADPIFTEREARSDGSLWDLVAAFLEWLLDSDVPAGQAASRGSMQLGLPGGVTFLVVGILLLLVVLVFLRLGRRPIEASSPSTAPEDFRSKAPEAWVGDANSLAAQGRLLEALRALYLATLVALDRGDWIRFEPSDTNWHYLRGMRPGPVREAFRAFTELFDHKVYGSEVTTREDFDRCRALASAIVEGATRRRES